MVVAGALLAAVIRLVPRRRRYRAIALLAKLAAPLIASTELGRWRTRMRLDRPRDTALDLLQRRLTNLGVAFDPVIRAEPPGVLERAFASGDPVCTVTVHTMLSTMILRWLHDRGMRMTIASVPRMPIAGTREEAEIVEPSPRALLTLARRLRAGEHIGGMVDRGVHLTTGVRFTTVRGDLRVSDELIRLAVRRRARIVFLAGRVDDRGDVVLHVAEPVANESAEIVGELVAFVQRFVAESAGIETISTPV